MTRRENVILAMKHQETLWIPNNVTDCDIVLQQAVQERYEGRAEGKDEFGVEYEFNQEANGPVQKVGTRVVSEVENWKEEVTFPNVEDRSWEELAARDTAGWDRENKFSIVQLYNGMFERAHLMMGFEDVLCALLEEPEIMEDWFRKFTDYRIRLIRQIGKYYKPDAIMIFDDYSAKESMMMSLTTWRELIKPQIQRMVETAHEMGMFYILHCCGYMRPMIEDFIEMRVDAVHPVQVSNNPRELKEKYGKDLCFCGGFNNVEILDREDVTEEECREEIRNVLTNVAPGGSYIAWKPFFCRHPHVFLQELRPLVTEKMRQYGAAIPKELQ